MLDERVRPPRQKVWKGPHLHIEVTDGSRIGSSHTNTKTTKTVTTETTAEEIDRDEILKNVKVNKKVLNFFLKGRQFANKKLDYIY